MTPTWISEARAALDAALSGDSPPLEFLPGENTQPPRWIERSDAIAPAQTRSPRSESAGSPHSAPEASSPPEQERAAVVVRTSGSTGSPKQTLLSAQALRASAEMTAQALGGHGQWLLTLQPSYVAGLAVLSRSLVAGTTPVALLENTTDPQRFTEAASQLTAERRYVSLVPTQLKRLMDHAGNDAQLMATLQRFDAILLGGGSTDPELFNAARHAELQVIRTYGMSETCGGCIYDGYPLPGVTVDLGTHGRVLLSGPMVSLGYLEDADRTAAAFDTEPATGHRRFRTDDLGTLSTETAAQVSTVSPFNTVARVTGEGHQARILPKLSLNGRVDDVIVTGAVKVSADQVRRALESHTSVREAFVAGVPDPEWGQKVVAAVVLSEISRQTDTIADIDSLIRQKLGPEAVPKHYELLGHLPLLANGKPDRQQLLKTLSTALNP